MTYQSDDEFVDLSKNQNKIIDEKDDYTEEFKNELDSEDIEYEQESQD